VRIEAAGGLTVSITSTVTIGWGETDWFGPGRLVRGASDLDLTLGEPVDVADDIGEATSLVVHGGDVIASIRAYRDAPIIVFRLEAAHDLTAIETGSYDVPSVGWPIFTPGDRVLDGVDPGSSALAFQGCEFGFPSGAGIALDRFFLLPHRPPISSPRHRGSRPKWR
jgi:hypothetical protein